MQPSTCTISTGRRSISGKDQAGAADAAAGSCDKACIFGRLSAWLHEGIGKARRFYLSHLRRGYIERMRKLRRGECKRCGKCCALFWKCPYIQESSQCRIYDKRFKPCSDFPIDSRDISGVCADCGHYFITEEQARAEAAGGGS